MSNLKQVAVIAGEGIGPEVIGETRRVLDWFVARQRLGIVAHEALYGSEAYRRTGKVVPDETAAAFKTADAILFGATGGPAYDALPAAARREGNLLRIPAASTSTPIFGRSWRSRRSTRRPRSRTECSRASISSSCAS
jgi:3-isopropylmalate dehydrogenase